MSFGRLTLRSFGKLTLKSFGRLVEGRNVRAPESRVPDNVWGARAHDKCSREKTADGLISSEEAQVRLKGCGKSAPCDWQQFVAR